MWIVEARSHDDSDTLDCSSFHVVDAVRLRTTVACQPDDRWRNSLNRRGGFSICFRFVGSRGRVHPRVPDWRNGVHENSMLCTFNCKNAHQSDHCALGRRIGGLATYAEQADDRRREDDLSMPLCDHVRPGSLHRVNRPTEVHAPILIKIINGGVLEWLASAYTGVVHEKVDSREMLDGHRDQVTSALRGGNVTVIRDCLASARPNEVGHLFRYRGVLPRPRYVGP